MSPVAETASILSLIIDILLIFFLVFANGFFVAAEFSLVSMRRSRVLALVEAGNRRATTLLRVITGLDAYLSATQLGITLASLGLGWIGEETIAKLLLPVFEQVLTHTYAVGAAHSAAIIVAFTIITFLHIVMGELAPKTLALVRTEAVALLVAWPMELFYKLFRWPISFLNRSGSLMLRAVGIRDAAEHAHSYTKDELRQLVEMSHQGGHLQNEELVMINNMIEFSETEVREAMSPRTEITAVSIRATIDEIYDRFIESGFSRLPVYRDDLDNIIGIIFLKDIVPYLKQKPGFSLAKLINRPLYLSETSKLSDALRQMRRSRMHMAIVVDEHGGTLGLLTLEDVLEQVVGEIQDENDQEAERKIVKVDENLYLIDAGVSMRDLNRELNLQIPEDKNYTTLAGFLMATAGQVLKVEHVIDYGKLHFTITKVDRNRIIEVKLEDQRV